MSIIIVFSGGVVRVTGSGLGCPTWPACETGSLTTTPALGIHGLIEFGNRLFTGVLILAVGWAIVAARLQTPRNRTLTRLAWSQFWLVVANSIAGGISVLTGLNPYVVALHFVMATALLTTTTLTWHRARQSVSAVSAVERTPARAALVDAAPGSILPEPPLPRAAGPLGWALAAATILLVAAGTLVTGSGQHSGDSAAVPRMGFAWADVALVHGTLGAGVVVLALALYLVLRGSAAAALARRRVVVFIVVTVVQALVGLIQASTGVPAALVAVHVLGSALVWVGVLRVLLDSNPRLFRAARPDATAAPSAVRAG